MSAESLREQIAEVLAGHQYAIVTSPLRPACMCGWEAGAEWSGTEVHDSHIADAVLAVLGEVTVTEQWGVSCLGDIGRRETRRHEDEAAARVDVADKYHLACQPQLVLRTVVTTRRVGEWEEAE